MYVRGPIADHHAGGEIEPEGTRRRQQEARCGFSARADRREVGMVWAHVDAVEGRSVGRKQHGHASMDGVDLFG